MKICTYRPAQAPAPIAVHTATAHPAILQEWEESERGWGVRPDGATLHLTEEDRVRYVAGFNAEFNPPTDDVPDEYRRVSGPARHVRVTPAAYAALIRRQCEDAVSNDEPSWHRHGISLVAGMLVMLKRSAPGGALR